MSESNVEAPRDYIAWATEADGARLCELFSSVSMEADLHLTVDRDPDFFALYNIQRATALTPILCLDAPEGRSIQGVACMLARDGFMHGRRERIGYMGDMRLTPRVRGRRFLGTHFADCVAQGEATLNCQRWYTAIIASNKAAIRALTEPNPAFPNKPIYRPYLDFQILNVQFTWRRRKRTDIAVRRANASDVDRISAFLAADHQQRPFGYDFGDGLLAHRLATWPGLSIDDFYLAEDTDGHLMGVTAPWDPHAIKRFRVIAYNGSMRWVRRGMNLLASVTSATKLPPPGGFLRYFYLTHVSIKDESPEVMSALVDQIYDDYLGKGFHFFSAFVMRDDPLAPAYRSFTTTPLPAKLFTVSPADRVDSPLIPGPGRPGFEMALV
jgi:hypothetical protein